MLNVIAELCLSKSMLYLMVMKSTFAAYINAYVCQGSAGVEPQIEAVGEIAEKLSEACVALEKTGKTSKRLYDAATVIERPTPVFVQVKAQLLTSMEQADNLASDLAFLCKYDKTRTGTTLSIDVANKMLLDAGIALQSLMEVSKSMRAMMPKVKAEP